MGEWKQRDYDEDHCWQYDIRLKNREEDLMLASLTEDQVANLRIKDFTFAPITEKDKKTEAIQFIHRHEWLGTIDRRPTHYFGTYYGDILAGVIILGVPNSPKRMETERLISRGACISWSPPNLASAFLTWMVRWTVQNTPYRYFSAYSDPDAKELGTVYQAANFYYLGFAGESYKYEHPFKPGEVVTSRFFSLWKSYRRYAIELGIAWDESWHHSSGMLWDNAPSEVKEPILKAAREARKTAIRYKIPSKHKYMMVLGVDRRETRRLKSEFEASTKVYPYPKERGK